MTQKKEKDSMQSTNELENTLPPGVNDGLNVCFSGSATGADTLFGECAEKVGHKVVHFTFRGHKKIKKHGFVLSDFHLIQADPHLFAANKYVRRKFPTCRPVVDNLLRRNYYQIEDSERIYAVCDIGDRGIPSGGTAWAVVMGILKGIKEVYVFSQDKWYKFECYFPKEYLIRWNQVKRVPVPSGHYTGIGSRELSPKGRAAILKLYGL